MPERLAPSEIARYLKNITVGPDAGAADLPKDSGLAAVVFLPDTQNAGYLPAASVVNEPESRVDPPAVVVHSEGPEEPEYDAISDSDSDDAHKVSKRLLAYHNSSKSTFLAMPAFVASLGDEKPNDAMSLTHLLAKISFAADPFTLPAKIVVPVGYRAKRGWLLPDAEHWVTVKINLDENGSSFEVIDSQGPSESTLKAKMLKTIDSAIKDAFSSANSDAAIIQLPETNWHLKPNWHYVGEQPDHDSCGYFTGARCSEIFANWDAPYTKREMNTVVNNVTTVIKPAKINGNESEQKNIETDLVAIDPLAREKRNGIIKIALVALGLTGLAGGLTVAGYFGLSLGFGLSGLALGLGTGGIGLVVVAILAGATITAMIIFNRTQTATKYADATSPSESDAKNILVSKSSFRRVFDAQMGNQEDTKALIQFYESAQNAAEVKEMLIEHLTCLKDESSKLHNDGYETDGRATVISAGIESLKIVVNDQTNKNMPDVLSLLSTIQNIKDQLSDFKREKPFPDISLYQDRIADVFHAAENALAKWTPKSEVLLNSPQHQTPQHQTFTEGSNTDPHVSTASEGAAASQLPNSTPPLRT